MDYRSLILTIKMEQELIQTIKNLDERLKQVSESIIDLREKLNLQEDLDLKH